MIQHIKKLFSLALFLCVLQNITAQNHQNIWFRTTLNIPVTEKFKTEFELQHRRQNDVESNSPFDKNLMYSFRTWMYYKKNKNLTFGLSPFAYFSNYKIIQKSGDAAIQPSHEYRFTASVELQNALTTKWFLVNRTAIEYRAFEKNITHTARLRNKLALKYEINAKYSTLFGDEVLINASGTDTQHIFDHNRLFANFSYQPKTNIKIDVGYIHSSRLLKNSTDLLTENNFFLNLTYTLAHAKPHL